MMKLYLVTFFAFGLLLSCSYAQTAPVQTYPKIAGYVGLLHPIATFSSAGTETNFKNYYAVGMPVGINIWKSARIGFSAEFVPTIRAEAGTSKKLIPLALEPSSRKYWLA